MDKKRLLILAAGKGTRMGPLGEHLPKPLWPVFKTNLLELQILIWKLRGVDEIYVNTHHRHDLISNYLQKNHPEVKVLHEKDLLDIGGAVHNLANQKNVNYKGKLFINNSDVFVFGDINLGNFLSTLESKNAASILNLIKINSEAKYTEVRTNDEGIVTDLLNEKLRDFWTYSGVSCIDLPKLKRSSGKSKFFDTVCNFQSTKVASLKNENQEYWDFGTLDLYCKALNSLVVDKSTQLYSFMRDSSLLNELLIV